MAAAIVVKFPATAVVRTKKQQKWMAGLYKEAFKKQPGRDPSNAWESALISNLIFEEMSKSRAAMAPMVAK